MNRRGILSAAALVFVLSHGTGFAHMFLNSAEPQCSGADPTVLMCDDYEDGTWYVTNGDSGGPADPQNNGWRGSIFATDPLNQNFARCGNVGAVGTNCTSSSGFRDTSVNDYGGQAWHELGPITVTKYQNVFHREYIWFSPGYSFGHEKWTFYENGHTTSQLGLTQIPFGNPTFDWAQQGGAGCPGRCAQNQGNDLNFTPGRWYYMETHLDLNNGLVEIWADDCGVNGLGCTGAGTLRLRWTGLSWSNAAAGCCEFHQENWCPLPGGAGTCTGEVRRDQTVWATRRIGPMSVAGSTGATYFTNKSGSDANSCVSARNAATAKVSILAGMACLAAGDTLLVGPGTYAESLINPFPASGNSWSIPTTVRAQQAALSVIVQPTSGSMVVALDGSTQKFIVFDGLLFDASNVNTYGITIRGNAHHARFINGGVIHAKNQAIFVNGDEPFRFIPSNNEFINFEASYTAMTLSGVPLTCNGGAVTQNGYCHGFYIGTNDNVLDNVNSHHNNGFGLQFYPQGNTNNIIRNSFMHDNLSVGVGALGTNNQVVNNVIVNNGGNGITITETGAQVLHNTITGFSEFLLGGGWTAKNNIMTGGVSGISDASNFVVGNPQFVSATDFHLQSTSPAVNTVTCLATVAADKDGVARPQGSLCDQGAYERGGTGGDVTPPAAPTGVTVQ